MSPSTSPRTRRRLLGIVALTLLAVAAIALPATAAGGATGPAAQTADEDASLSFDSTSQELGDVAEIGLESVRGTDTVWLTIAEDHDLYNATVAVTLADPDEPATLRWNSHHLLNRSRDLGVSAGENVRSIRVVESSGAAFDVNHLPADGDWQFTIETFTAREDVADGNYRDVAGVTLSERRTDAVEPTIAPGSLHDHDDDLDAILADATARSTVARGDLLVAEVRVSGVFGYLNATSDGLGGEGLSLELRGPDGQNGTRTLSVADLGDDARIVTRPAEDRLYLVVDAGALPAADASDDWAVRFAVDGAENPYVASDETEGASTTVAVEDPRVDVVGEFTPADDLLLPASESAPVAAETNVAPGTEAAVRVNLPQEFRTGSGVVAADGTVSVPVDLSGYQAGTRLALVRVRVANANSQGTVEGLVGDESSSGPQFGVETGAPRLLDAGENGTLDVLVANEGNATGIAHVDVAVNASGSAGRTESDRVELEPGESWERSFALGADEPGTASWRVTTQHSSRTGSVPVREPIAVGGHEPAPRAGSELYWDFTGDGSVDQVDVVEFFRHHFYDAVQDRPERFDFSGNDAVGHGDVVELFRVVATFREPWNASASIADAPSEVPAGDVIEVDVDVEEHREAWVRLEDDAGNYSATVHLVDVAPGGEVTLRANTRHLANGTPSAAFSATGATVDAGATTESGPLADDARRLPVGTTLSFAAGADAPPDPGTDSATVRLVERPPGTVTTAVAPAGADLSSPAAVRASSTERDAVAAGDHLVASVDAAGDAGTLPTDPARLGEGELDVEVVGPEGIFGNRAGGSLSEYRNATRLLPAPDEGRYYAVLDTSALTEVNDGAELTVRVTRSGATDPYDPVAATRNATGTVTFEERELALRERDVVGEQATLPPEADATVRATTNAAPGTAATVDVAVGDATLSRSTTVRANGTVLASVDLSDREVGERLRSIRVEEAGGAAIERVGVVLPTEDALRESLAVEASGPDVPRVGAPAGLNVTFTNTGDGAGYATALVTVGGNETYVSRRLEPGESSTRRFDVDTGSARVVPWSVEAPRERIGGAVVVEDPSATVNASVVAAPWPGDVRIPIDVTGDPDVAYVDLRSPDGQFHRGVEVRDPAEEVVLTWNTSARTGAFTATGGDAEVVNEVGYSLGPGEYEVHVGTAVPIVTHADDVTPVVVGNGSLDGVHAEAAGDVVTVPVGPSSDAAVDRVTIEAVDGLYEATLTPDDPVTSGALRWNTNEALHTGAGVSLRGGDLREVRTTSLIDAEGLEPGRYDVVARANGTAVERRQVVLTPPGVEDVTVHATHRRYLDSSYSAPEPEAPATVVEGAARRDRMAADDRLVAEIRASGLEGLVGNATPASLAEAGLEVTLSSDAGASVDLRNASDATVVARPAADRIYAVVDTRDLPGPVANRTWTVAARLDGDVHPHLPDGDASRAEASVAVEPRRVEIGGQYGEDGQLLLPAVENAPVPVQTNAAPGTRVSLRINLPRDFRTATTTVDRTGRATPTVDLSSLEPGTQLSIVRVRVPDTEAQATTEGRIESA